jgi:hypothetical protein
LAGACQHFRDVSPIIGRTWRCRGPIESTAAIPLNEDAARASLEPLGYLRFEARLIALRTTVSPLTLSSIAGKMRQARYPSNGARCQVYRRDHNIHVSQENYYWAKVIRKATGHHTGYRKNKCRNQELRENAAPTNQ